MNKRKVDELIPQAYMVLKSVKIASSDDKVDKKWRGQISSFGASVATGSLLSAIAFFNAQGGSDLDRKLLIDAIGKLIESKPENLFKYVCTCINNHNERKVKEEVINAAIALKLAMNLYDLRKGD